MMTPVEKLAGGRKPFFIDTTDGDVVGKNFFLLVILADTVFTTLESKVKSADTAFDEKTDMNIVAKTIKAGAVINCDGLAYFSKVNIASGQIAAYKANV